jgi:hypothetical protein
MTSCGRCRPTVQGFTVCFQIGTGKTFNVADAGLKTEICICSLLGTHHSRELTFGLWKRDIDLFGEGLLNRSD